MTEVEKATRVAELAIWRSDYERLDAAKRAHQIKADAHNRSAILGALSQAGIAHLDVRFDGYGDSGQIEETSCMAVDKGVIDMPDVSVEMAIVVDDGSGLEIETLSLAAAVERFCYDALETNHDGWEINQGAYGDFSFDVVAGTIRYVHNTRYLSEDTSVAEL